MQDQFLDHNIRIRYRGFKGDHTSVIDFEFSEKDRTVVEFELAIFGEYGPHSFPRSRSGG
jgi:hypothetical protein